MGRRAPNQSTSGTISTGRRHLRGAVPLEYSELPAIVSVFRPEVEPTLRGTPGAVRSEGNLNCRTTIRHDSPPTPLGANSLLDKAWSSIEANPNAKELFPPFSATQPNASYRSIPRRSSFFLFSTTLTYFSDQDERFSSQIGENPREGASRRNSRCERDRVLAEPYAREPD